MSSEILLFVECSVSLMNFKVTALKTFKVALEFRISYSSAIEAIRKSIINKTLLKFFLIWNYLICEDIVCEHKSIVEYIRYFITFFVLIKEKFVE